MDLTGHFLIAMPGLEDPNFERTVTFMCVHNDEGAMGIVINRPTELCLGEVLTHMSIKASNPQVDSMAVLQGGPVERERGFVLHQPSGEWDSMIKVGVDVEATKAGQALAADTGRAQVGIALSLDILNAVAAGEGPDRALFVLGYAGWGAGQLEREVRDNAWLNAPAASEVIFEVPYADRWERAAKLMGVDVARLSSGFGNA